MNFDLTRYQALTLHSAAHLVMEYLPVSDKKRRALDEAQQALRKALGIEQVIAASVTQQTYTSSEREYRGFMDYTYGYVVHNDENVLNPIPCPYVGLVVYYDKQHEDVAVILSFAGSTFPLEDYADDEEEGENRPFPDVASYGFPAWYGASVQLTINTPTGKKEATYLLTKEGATGNSDTIEIVICPDCPTVLRK